MKIWSDTTETSQFEMNDCAAPRMNDCAAPNRGMPITFSLEDMENIRNYTLRLHTLLHIQPCDDARWLVCVPTGSGRLAVLDKDALQLLQTFEQGKTPLEVAEQHTKWSNTSIEEGAAFFLQAGFLQPAELAPASQNDAQEDTLTSWLHITNSCNLKCQYCYIAKTNESMTDDIARRAVDAIFRSAKKQGFQRVVAHAHSWCT